jgi:hypothetical protein
MHVIATPGRKGVTVGDKRVTNNRISAFKPIDCLSDLFDPAGIFMSHNVWQLHVDFLAPNTFDHMKIGAANAGTTDSDHNVGRALDFRFRYFFESNEIRIGESGIILMEDCRFHKTNPVNGEQASPLLWTRASKCRVSLTRYSGG